MRTSIQTDLLEKDTWTTAELAEFLQVRRDTIYSWRSSGKGPIWFRSGGPTGHVRYRREDVQAFIEDAKVAEISRRVRGARAMKFTEWLFLPAQLSRTDAVGELARAAQQDPEWPEDGGLVDCTGRVIALGSPVRHLTEAWARWRAER